MTQTIQATGHPQPEQLNALIDGELTRAEAQDIQEHLDDCHPCSLQALSMTRLKMATARAGQSFAAPPETLARLTAQLRSRTAPIPVVPPRRSYFALAAALPAIAAAILVMASILAWQQFHQANALSAELLDQHLAVLSSAATPQVVSTDRHTVKPWFQGRLPFSFNLPDQDALPPDTTLQGADLVYLEDRPAALLLFTIHKHEVSVFVSQRTGAFALTPHSSRSGFTITSVAAGEVRLTAVSDVNPAELNALVANLARVQ